MRVILINSTEFNNHHGCELVSAQIKKFLQLYKIELINECYNFETYFQIIEKVKNSKFDIALVNGEGTMHDCQEQSISLLNVSEYINLYLKKKIILFNASVENMDKEIHKFKNFYKIYVRDFDSYNYLKSKKYKSKFNSDMLITYQIEKNLKKKTQKNSKDIEKNILINDSVNVSLTKNLIEFSKKKKLFFLTIRTSPRLKIWLANCSIKSKIRNTFYLLVFFFYKIFRFVVIKNYQFTDLFQYYENNTKKYLCKILSSEFVITARYHQLILCLVLNRPFFALDSITSKNSSLLNDLGMSKRKINKNYLNNIQVADLPDFSKREIKNINIYKKKSIEKIKHMFLEFKKIKI